MVSSENHKYNKNLNDIFSRDRPSVSDIMSKEYVEYNQMKMNIQSFERKESELTAEAMIESDGFLAGSRIKIKWKILEDDKVKYDGFEFVE